MHTKHFYVFYAIIDRGGITQGDICLNCVILTDLRNTSTLGGLESLDYNASVVQ